MGPLNNTFHVVNSWNTPGTGIFKKEILSRATNIAVTLPTEIAAVGQNALQSVVYTGSTVVKSAAKALSYISGSEAIKNFEDKLPGFRDLLGSISKIVAYAFGCLLTATVGFVYPAANFKMHCNLNLIRKLKEEVKNEKAQEEKTALEEEAAVQKELNEAELADAHVLLEEILKEEETQEDDLKNAFETFKKEVHENCECSANQIEQNIAVDVATIQTGSNEIEEASSEAPQQNVAKKDAEQTANNAEVINQDHSITENKSTEVFRKFFDKEIGKDKYHYFENIGIIIPKTPVERARDFVASTANNAWNRLPNVRERISNLRASNN